MKQYLCSVFEKESFDQITINFLANIIERTPKGPMTDLEVQQFKTAFVIFLVTKFLAPVSLNNYVSSRYMKPLVDIENVHKYNWAKFALDELKIAADSIQNKILHKKGAGYVNSCITLIQVFYLDNLDNGNNTPQHDCLPRIRSYNDNIMTEIIQRDVVLQNRIPFPSFGKLKLRDRQHVCYGNLTLETYSQNQEVVTEGIDPPSFDLGLSQPDIPIAMGEWSTQSHVHGNLNAAFAEVGDPQVVPDTPPNRQGMSNTGSTSKTVCFSSPHSILKEVSGVRIEMREMYAVTKYPPKSKRRIIGEPADMLLDRPVRTIKPSRWVKSPFLCKQRSFTRYDSKAVDDLLNYIFSIHDKDSIQKLWVHISNPVPMKLHLHDIQQALKMDQAMHDDTFNVAVQVLYEDEIHRFGSTEFLGWRHFLNQDFSMYAIADNGHWDPSDHIHYFNDDTLVPYDMSACRLIFVPVHLVEHFALYVFVTDDKTITILDPICDISMTLQIVEQRHTKTVMQVSNALHDSFKLSFSHWNDHFPSWKLKLPKTNLPPYNKVDSAFHVLNYMKNWDGSRLVNTMSMDSPSMRKEFLVNLLSFNNNESILPQPVQNLLKQASRR